MSNLITEIYDKQAVVDNLNQLGELINSSLNAIVSASPKLQSPIDYMTALKSVDEIEKESIKTAEAKKKALSDLDKLYQQADKAIQQYDNLADAEYQTQTNLLNQYKEMTKEQKQLIEIERTRNQTMQNSQKLLSAEAKTEAELRMQTQQLIKASQSLRLTNADENKVREQLIAKINANKEALKGMTNEVSKQKDNIGNYKSALEGVVSGQIDLREAMVLTRKELQQLETLQATGVALTEEQRKRYDDLNEAMGQMKDIQGDIAQRTKILADDYRNMTFTMEGIKLGVNIMTSLKAITALVGNENEELAKTMAQVVAVQQTLNTLQEIQKQLNKDSVVMTNLRIAKEQFLARQSKINTEATIAYAAAENVAQKGAVGLSVALKSVGNAMKTIPIIGWIAAAIGALVALISKLRSMNEEQNKFHDDFRKKVAETAAENIAKYELLGKKFSELGNDMKAKEQFIKDNKKAFEDLGLSVNSVADAENVLIKQKDDFIAAEMAKAKATAARSMSVEIFAEILDAQMKLTEATKKLEREEETLDDIIKGKVMVSAEQYSATLISQRNAVSHYQSEVDNLNASIESNTKKVHELFSQIELNTKVTKNKTQANKDLSASLEELTESEELWTKTQLNDIFKNTTKNLTEQVNATAELIDKKKELNQQILDSIEIEEEEAEPVKTLTELLKEQKEAAEKLKTERKEAYDAMVENIGSAFDAINGYYEHQQEVTDEWYQSQKERIEASVVDEETREKRLAQLDAEKTKRDKETAKKQAEIKRRQAIFQNAVDSAMAISQAVASVGKLLATESEGDPYTAIARYIAAVAAGVSAVTTISTLISRLLNIPAYEKGGLAEADKPFIAGEKGREIGFGQRTGKVYDFASPAIYKAPEPVAIKTASETNRIINNEYNKDVTLHNEVVVQVIDNKRVEKYFKIGRKS